MSERVIDMDAAAWAACPHIKGWRGAAPICQQCPATVHTSYGPAVQMCRSAAEEVAQSVVNAIKYAP